jgi:mono/diheme cytochrome c family protein
MKQILMPALFPFLTTILAFTHGTLRAQDAVAEAEVDKAFFELAKDPEVAKRGAKIFPVNCALCHLSTLPEGAPMNLKDANWIHGTRPSQIQATIIKGVAEKNMPAFEKILKPDQIQALVVYIMGLNTPQPGTSPQP